EAAGEFSPPSKVLTGRGRTRAHGLRALVFGSPIVADQPAKGDGVNMSRLLQRLLGRKTGAVKRSRQRQRLQVEALEDRITPIIAVLVGSSLDVTSAAIALPPPTPGPQEVILMVVLDIDGTMHIGSDTGGAGGEKTFTIEDVATLTLGPGEGQTSFKVPFDEAI